jgi:serine/threonine-protein kinase
LFSRDAAMILFHVHGTTELRAADGRSLLSVLSQPKRTALLAYLVIADPGRFQRRDTLLGIFWPELDEQRARNALSQALHYLRRSLGEGVVVSRGEGEVGIAEGLLWCDAVAFEDAIGAGRLEEALEHYRGEILSGLNLDGVPEFERWLDAVRARKRSCAAGAAWQLAEGAEQAGDLAGSAVWARRAAGLQEGDEAALRRLLLHLDRAGDRAGALHTYEAFARHLEVEFEAEPSPQTIELIAEIRSRTGSVGEAGAVAGGAAMEPEALPAGPAPAPTGSDAAAPAGNLPHAMAPASPAGALSAGQPDSMSARTEAAAGIGSSALDSASPGGVAGAALPVAPRRRWRRPAVIALLALLATLTLAGMASRWRRDTGPRASAGDFRVVAVFPFAVQGGSELSYLGRGMTDLLSAKLDGAGGLRSMDPRAVLGVVDRGAPTAQDLRGAGMIAEQLGADLFVLGSLVAHGGQVQVNATLYEGGVEAPIARAAVEGRVEQVFELVDRLAAELLAEQRRGPGAGLVRLAATTTTSLPALKAYLEGEDALRAGRYALAQESFQNAVGLDSTFALAYYRLAVAAVWSEPDSRLPTLAVREAIHHGARLSERVRLLLHAFQAFISRDAVEAERLYRMVLSTHPNEVEAWYHLGEVLYHYGPLLGSPLEESAGAFERVLYFEPGNGESLMHLARVAARRRDTVALDSLVGHLLAVDPERDRRLELRALRAGVSGDTAEWSRIITQSSQASDQVITTILFSTSVHTGDHRAALDLARLLTHPSRPPLYRGAGYGMVAQLELARGRWSSARAALAELARLEPTSALIIGSLFAASPLTPATEPELRDLGERAEALAATVSSSSMRSISLSLDYLPFLRHYLAGLLHVKRGDREGALAQAHSLSSLGGVRSDARLGADLAMSIIAAAAWEQGDAGATLSALEMVPLGPQRLKAALGYAAQGYERFLFGEALAAEGRYDDALRWYGSFPEPGGYDLIYLAPSHLRRAEIYERQGEGELAALHYARFIELWEECDPELRPMVEAAAERLARLSD